MTTDVRKGFRVFLRRLSGFVLMRNIYVSRHMVSFNETEGEALCLSKKKAFKKISLASLTIVMVNSAIVLVFCDSISDFVETLQYQGITATGRSDYLLPCLNSALHEITQEISLTNISTGKPIYVSVSSK